MGVKSQIHTHSVAQGHHLANLTMLLPWSWHNVLWAHTVVKLGEGLCQVSGKVKALHQGQMTGATPPLSVFPKVLLRISHLCFIKSR